MSAPEALSQHFNPRKGRVIENGIPVGKRVLVRSLAAVHRSRQLNVCTNTEEREQLARSLEPYFVDAEKAKQLVESNQVILVKDAHGNIATEG